MKPSTLAALMRGDIENAIISETPGGIEAQEAQGQRDFVASETLPIKCNFCTREQLEQMGIVFGEPVDDLFIECQLPGGWKKVPTDHSMWSHLVDDKGRRRASIFYKAAFYDRSAHISLDRRFSYRVEPTRGYDAPDYKLHGWHCVVTDSDEVIWTSSERMEPEPEYNLTDRIKKSNWRNWADRKKALNELGKNWLEEHYPDWRDPLAYWD